MRVYNLTATILDFHRKLISPDGGYVEVPELDQFVSNTDQRLAMRGVVAFGSLPLKWSPKKK